MPDQRYRAQKLALFTAFIIALIAVAAPSGYYLSSYKYMEGELHAHARMIAGAVSAITTRNPEMWQYEHTRLLDAISKPEAIGPDMAVRILRMDGTVVVETDRYIRKPVISQRIEIYDSGDPIGKVEAVRSLVPLLGITFFIGIAGLVTGWLVYTMIKILFLRTLLETEKAQRAREMEFRNFIEEAPLAITVVNKAGVLEYSNRKNIEVTGYTLQETPTLEAWWSLAYPDPEERRKNTAVWGSIQQRILSDEHVGKSQRRITCKDGTIKDVELSFSKTGDKILVMFNDVTENKKAEEALQRYSAELERKNMELQTALGKVKTLSGMLPICASCKKIRDDNGYWSGVADYITQHSDVLFSHGMCPECQKEAYEELERQEIKEQKQES
jgi:PAS domain S-box-containing protein